MGLAASSSAQVTVSDGDTLKMGGVTYRLWGIDAPETKQVCTDSWPAGQEATAYLRDLVKWNVAVTCTAKTTDRYGGTVAVYLAGGSDLGGQMVRAEMAYAFRRYSGDYIPEENLARLSGLGVHARSCELPSDWRARNRGDQ